MIPLDSEEKREGNFDQIQFMNSSLKEEQRFIDF